MKPTPPPRLSILQAPKADTAVLFRRGPSKYVEVIRWNMREDRFERGHWFNGRIYTRRSDLSPDGELLVYFASKFNSQTIRSDYTYAWTAVSRPPWLTALALWPKGDCWWGGGMFTGRRQLVLNHRPDQATPHPDHLPPRELEVTPDENAKGEDDPLYSRRLDRDGWQVVQEWDRVWQGWGQFYLTRKDEVRQRRHPTLPFTVSLHRRIDRLEYSESFAIEGDGDTFPLPPGHVEWADWDSQGRAFALVGGTLQAAAVSAAGVGPFETLADFTADRFEPKEAPPEATQWRRERA